MARSTFVGTGVTMVFGEAVRGAVRQFRRALRERAGGLGSLIRRARNGSDGGRITEIAPRERRDLRSPHAAPSPDIDVQTCGYMVPCLGLIGVDELVEIVASRGSLEAEDATRAVQRGVLCAGYRTDCDDVTAADAFDIVEEALRFRF